MIRTFAEIPWYQLAIAAAYILAIVAVGVMEVVRWWEERR